MKKEILDSGYKKESIYDAALAFKLSIGVILTTIVFDFLFRQNFENYPNFGLWLMILLIFPLYLFSIAAIRFDKNKIFLNSFDPEI